MSYSVRDLVAAAKSLIREIGPAELLELQKFGYPVVDVREPEEHAVARIEGARLIPLRTLPDELDGLPRDREILVHCKAGGRSAKAVQLLLDHGFHRVKNVSGGIDAWLAES